MQKEKTVKKDMKSKLPFAQEVIKGQLKRMLASAEFKATPNQKAFLKFIVEQTLAGKAHAIKGQTVATKVFGRGKEFNQNKDPIVSVQAAGLRRALAYYYRTEGRNDPLCIDIPKGSYVPVFKKLVGPLAAVAGMPGMQTDIGAGICRRSVLVGPLQNLSGNPEFDAWGRGLEIEFVNELNRYSDIRVMATGTGRLLVADAQRAPRFELDGGIRSDGDCIKIDLQLKDTLTGRQIWSNSRRSPIGTARRIVFQEELARAGAVEIAGQKGWIARTLVSDLTRREPDQIDSHHEAVLHYFAYIADPTPHKFAKTMDALKRALELKPECGQAWSMLARLHADAHGLELPGFKEPLETAFEYAQNGAHLSPGEQRSRIVLAYVHFLRNEMNAAREEIAQALKLGGEALYMRGSIGYMLTHLGDWERGRAMIDEVIRLNPLYDGFVHFALWLDCIHRSDYDQAYQETLKINRPGLFWSHLARAATLGHRGQIEEGRKAAGNLLELKPDFVNRGEILIRNYIKFDEIVERVIDGLAAVGVRIT